MSAKPSFKRSELPTPRVQVYFTVFAFLSLALLWLFLSEEYRASLDERMAMQDFETLTLSTHSSMNAFSTPLGAAVLSLWVLCSLVFAWVFNRRLKVMFQLFFSLSFLMLLIFNFWSYFVSAALEDPDSRILVFTKHLQYSPLLKAFLLLFWGFFGIYFCISAGMAKYIGVFNRLNYLFTSITRGNWDSFMFFRNEDPFSFLAKSFNTLKDHYLDQLHREDERLIALKDSLSGGNRPGLKQELLRLVSNRDTPNPA